MNEITVMNETEILISATEYARLRNLKIIECKVYSDWSEERQGYRDEMMAAHTEGFSGFCLICRQASNRIDSRLKSYMIAKCAQEYASVVVIDYLDCEVMVKNRAGPNYMYRKGADDIQLHTL